jgi:hypothetical protein
MKKFLFLYIGAWTPTQEIKDAWGAWFGEVGDRIVDSGNPFGPGKEYTKEGVRDLPWDLEIAAGYTIFEAESLDAAMEMAKTCPIVTGVRVYELVSM